MSTERKDGLIAIEMDEAKWLAVSHYAEEHVDCIPGIPDPDAIAGIRAIDRAMDEYYFLQDVERERTQPREGDDQK